MVIDKANVATQEEKDMNITILAQVQQEIIIKRFAENSHQNSSSHIDSMQLLLHANLESISISIWVGGVGGSTALLQLKDVIVKAKISHSWW